MSVNHSHTPLDSFLYRISKLSIHHPWKIISLAVLITISAVYYISGHLGVNTDTSAMLSPDLPYQVNLRRLMTTFPQDQDTIVTLIESQTPEQARLITKELYRRVAAKPDLFQYPYSPGNSQFFEQNGLLYLELDELEDLATNLAKAQPFLGKLADNYSLDGLFPVLQLALEHSASGDELPMDLSVMLTEVNHALAAASRGQSYPVSWQTMMFGNTSQVNRKQQVVIAKPIQDFTQLHPAGKSMAFLRSQKNSLEKQYNGSNIDITGSVALDHEELETALSSSEISAAMALSLITVCLFFGLRSYKMVFATFTILITGLIWTTGFAAVAIGHLNIISLAFAVLYIGLGVDYAIHYCLRYQESTNPEFNPAIIQQTTHKIGPSLLLCATTTSIGFFSFIPTDFLGVSELGMIAGTGIFIGLFVTLTILPALLVILRTDSGDSHIRIPHWIAEFPLKQHRTIKALSLLIAVFAAILLSKVTFDPDPINLKDPKSESVIAFKKLLLSDYFSPLTITILKTSQTDTLGTEQQLKQLKTVKDVITLFDFIPGNQDEKLDLIDNLSLLVGNHIQRLTQTPDDIDNADSIIAFKHSVDTLVDSGNTPIEPGLLSDLQTSLNNYLASLTHSSEPKQLLNLLQNNLLGYLPFAMQNLAHGLNAEPISLGTLTNHLRERWYHSDQTDQSEIYRIEVLPRQSLTRQADLHEFVREVQSIEADATGFPVVMIESTDAIVNAFIQAFLSAFVVIMLILIITLKSLKSALLVIWPLALGGLLTCASTVIFNTPFNYVNVIALPLLLGIGVDNGIHIIQRFRSASSNENPLQTSTTPAIFFSNLTTVLSFFSLTLTSHAGMASMGWLLAVGVIFAVISTIIILPAYQITVAD